jgi:hypothetical protein
LGTQHPSSQRIIPDQPWKIQTHTDLFHTNAFGTLEYQVAEALTTKAEVKKMIFF